MRAGISTTISASTPPIPKASIEASFGPLTATGIAGTVAGTGFAATNVKWSINGYIYGNMPLMMMKQGDHVRWYVTTLGDFNNAHTPHWHGNTVWSPASALTF